MTNAEINQQQAVKALEQGSLNAFEAEFVKSIQHYSNDEFAELSAWQYQMLRVCAKRYIGDTYNVSDQYKHTPAPWWTDDWGGVRLRQLDDNSKLISIMAESNLPLLPDTVISIAIVQADNEKPVVDNANRIVECVNAMEGIEDPALWRKATETRLNELIDERNILLAALQRWQDEYIGSLCDPAQRANNYSIELQIKEAIEHSKRMSHES